MKRTLLFSDMSGQPIEGKAATLSIQIEGETFVYKLDITEAEAHELGAKGRKDPKRGRPAKKKVAVPA